jgi:hypothetical protein
MERGAKMTNPPTPPQMANIFQFPSRPEYEAKAFHAAGWTIAGTLCGNVDVAMPDGTYCMTPDEVQTLIVALTNARADVLANSAPLHDPRIYEQGERR